MPLVSKFNTIAEMFIGVTKYFKGSNKDAFMRKVNGKYEAVKYDHFYLQVEALALGLRSLGLERGDSIGIMSENRLEWIMTDLACASCGYPDVPTFPILTPKQLEFIFNDAKVKAIVCSNSLQLGKLAKIIDDIPTLKHIIVMQPDALEKFPILKDKGAILFDELVHRGKRLAEAVPGQLEQIVSGSKPTDLLTLIYTSGTTGNPKGVMLTHRNLVSNMYACADFLPINETDVVLSYLPLCHSYERMAGYYTCFACGATIAFADSIDTVAENLLEIKPTIMTSVPRLFERIKHRVEKNVLTQKPFKQKMFHWAISIGKQAYYKKSNGEELGLSLATKQKLADSLVLTKIRERTGGRIKFFTSGGAPLSRDVGEFFFAVGLKIIEGYGLTETSPVISFTPFENPILGTVGKVLNNLEVKIAEDGEILVKGPSVMQGYLNNPESTKEAIDDLGWFHTGDIGIFENGNLKITDRKKNIIVSSGGKNIAPAPIENDLLQSRFVDQVLVVGDNKPFLIALIVPNIDFLRVCKL